MTEPLTIDQRIARLQTYHREGRIIRHAWTTRNGCACLLSAFSPEVADIESRVACPESAMPRWLAYVTPDINDCCSLENHALVCSRHVAVLPKLLQLNPERLNTLRAEACASVGAVTITAFGLGEAAGARARAANASGGQAAMRAEWDRIIDTWLTQWEQVCAEVPS